MCFNHAVGGGVGPEGAVSGMTVIIQPENNTRDSIGIYEWWWYRSSMSSYPVRGHTTFYAGQFEVRTILRCPYVSLL